MNPAASLGSPSVYELVPPLGYFSHISRVCFLIQDTNCNIGKFGGLAALTNGLKVESYNDQGVLDVDFLDGETIKTNEEFDLLSGADVIGIDNTKAVDAVPVRWTVEKGTSGAPLLLLPGSILRVTIQDDLSGITNFRAMTQGVIFKKPSS
jgi:hypothetical protein